MTESQLQQKLVIWFKNNVKGLIFSVPNGGSRNILEAKNLKLTGQMAGVSDLIVLLENKCIFIEVKIEKRIQSEVQNKFQQRVEALGFDYHIIRTLDDFQKLITRLRNPEEKI
jgi:hypothetical protein